MCYLQVLAIERVAVHVIFTLSKTKYDGAIHFTCLTGVHKNILGHHTCKRIQSSVIDITQMISGDRTFYPFWE
jgi:hypothetical protein